MLCVSREHNTNYLVQHSFLYIYSADLCLTWSYMSCKIHFMGLFFYFLVHVTYYDCQEKRPTCQAHTKRRRPILHRHVAFGATNFSIAGVVDEGGREGERDKYWTDSSQKKVCTFF